VIFYDFDGETVDIYAVLDCRQDPAKTAYRLGSAGPKPPR